VVFDERDPDRGPFGIREGNAWGLSRGFSYMWRREKLRNLVNLPQELKVQVNSGV
jgi:hypothetical protein